MNSLQHLAEFNNGLKRTVVLMVAVPPLLWGCGVAQTVANLKQQADLKEQIQAVRERNQAIQTQCKADLQTPELDPIRSKVELYREPSSIETPPPFEIASNDTFPTEPERTAIRKWAAIRDACIARQNAILVVPASANAVQTVFVQQEFAFGKEMSGHVGQLIVSLYQQKLSYGEFAQRRYEITRDTAVAERQFRQAALISDQQRQMQERQLAQQEFQSRVAAWSAYTQAVSARQPQTVRLNANCMSQQLGAFTTTNCN